MVGHYEPFKPTKRYNLKTFCLQLDNVNAVVPEQKWTMFNRNSIILHHHNVRKHADCGFVKKLQN